MKKLTILVCVILLLTGCSEINLVSKYDEVIDKGITEFAEQLNTHVKNMGDLGGKPEGTYLANLTSYNALDSKLDVMIARTAATSGGLGCKLEQEIFDQIKLVLKNDIPAVIESEATTKEGDANGCNTKLLELVKTQLTNIRNIHKDTDKCSDPQGNNFSCLRPATANLALKIANQSINAVSIVETAKKP